MSILLLGYNQFLCADELLSGHSFSLSLFEDLNRLIEGVVLYDNVMLLGEYPTKRLSSYSILEDAGVISQLTDKALRDRMTTVEFEGAFKDGFEAVFGKDRSCPVDPIVLLQERIPPSPFHQDILNESTEAVVRCFKSTGYDRDSLREWLGARVLDTRARGGHFQYFARGLIYSSVAECGGWDYAPDFLRLPLAALSFRPKSRPVPKALYDALSVAFESEVEALATLGMPVAVFVPPLTAKALKRGGRGERLVRAALELRREFAGLRSAYSEFRRNLEDPSRTLREHIASKKRMYDQILGMLDGDKGHALNVRTVWEKLVSASLDEAGSSSKLSLSGAVSLLLDQLSQTQVKGRAKALFDLWADTTNMENYGGLLESSLGVRVDTEEARFVKTYSEAVRCIIRT